MSDYTPTTAQIRTGYASVAYTDEGVDLRLVEFDRWLAAHDAEVRAGVVAEEPPSMKVLDERDPECVKAWPDCASGAYDPACCRFPKSCSAGVVRMVPVKQEGADQ